MRTLEALEGERSPRREAAEKERAAGETAGLRSLAVGRWDGDDAMFSRRVTEGWLSASSECGGAHKPNNG